MDSHVGNEAQDDPSKEFLTVNGTKRRSQGLKPCKLYDDDDDALAFEPYK
jgi:hypothetical protein